MLECSFLKSVWLAGVVDGHGIFYLPVKGLNTKKMLLHCTVQYRHQNVNFVLTPTNLALFGFKRADHR